MQASLEASPRLRPAEPSAFDTTRPTPGDRSQRYRLGGDPELNRRNTAVSFVSTAETTGALQAPQALTQAFEKLLERLVQSYWDQRDVGETVPNFYALYAAQEPLRLLANASRLRPWLATVVGVQGDGSVVMELINWGPPRSLTIEVSQDGQTIEVTRATDQTAEVWKGLDEGVWGEHVHWLERGATKA